MRPKTVRTIKKRLAIDRAAKLPAQVFVTWSDPDPKAEDRVLEAGETTEHVEHGAVVGVYQLVSTRVMRITRTLE